MSTTPATPASSATIMEQTRECNRCAVSSAARNADESMAKLVCSHGRRRGRQGASSRERASRSREPATNSDAAAWRDSVVSARDTDVVGQATPTLSNTAMEAANRGDDSVLAQTTTAERVTRVDHVASSNGGSSSSSLSSWSTSSWEGSGSSNNGDGGGGSYGRGMARDARVSPLRPSPSHSGEEPERDDVFAVVTIDSNDVALPPLIASHLCAPASAWCRSNRCRRIGKKSRAKKQPKNRSNATVAGRPTSKGTTATSIAANHCEASYRDDHGDTAAAAYNDEADDEAEIYYDTPLAVYTDRRDVSRAMQGRTYVHFVYLDFTQRNVSLDRLLSNLRSRENVILLVNEDPAGEHERRGATSLELPVAPAYLLRTGNVSVQLVAEVVASIVNAFLLEERLLHADDVVDLVCGKPVAQFRSVTSGMRVDIPRMIACRNARHSPLNDCVECR